MNADEINREIADCLDSILCLCVEGVEFLTKLQLSEAVIKECRKGLAALAAKERE